jgi:hypothetical protein
MTDYQIAKQFFEMLSKRGFGVQEVDYQGNKPGEEEFTTEGGVSFELLDSRKKAFCIVDFLGERFYRISGTDSTGWYGDEVDLRKYE